MEVSGKTVDIGCERIGQEVANCAKALGEVVKGYDPVEVFKEAGIERVELQSIWKNGDTITVHTPLMPETSNLLNETTLAQCKRGVVLIFVNCALGGIMTEEVALLKMVESGRVGGAALDVFTSEPPKGTLAAMNKVQHKILNYILFHFSEYTCLFT